MKNAIFYISFVILLITACTKETDNDKQLTYDDFKNSLTMHMDYDAIIEEFGQPARDIGSGIHIYVYELDDSTEIWIGYIDHILYARHVDKNQQLLETLI